MNEKPITEVLQAVADAAEETKDSAAGPRFRNKRARRDPSQVYAIRIPVQVLEDVRRLAAERGTQPSALMREWVLDRLNEEVGEQPSRAERRPRTSSPGKVFVHVGAVYDKILVGQGKNELIYTKLTRSYGVEGVV